MYLITLDLVRTPVDPIQLNRAIKKRGLTGWGEGVLVPGLDDHPREAVWCVVGGLVIPASSEAGSGIVSAVAARAEAARDRLREEQEVERQRQWALEDPEKAARSAAAEQSYLERQRAREAASAQREREEQEALEARKASQLWHEGPFGLPVWEVAPRHPLVPPVRGQRFSPVGFWGLGRGNWESGARDLQILVATRAWTQELGERALMDTKNLGKQVRRYSVSEWISHRCETYPVGVIVMAPSIHRADTRVKLLGVCHGADVWLMPDIDDVLRAVGAVNVFPAPVDGKITVDVSEHAELVDVYMGPVGPDSWIADPGAITWSGPWTETTTGNRRIAVRDASIDGTPAVFRRSCYLGNPDAWYGDRSD